MLVVLVLGRSEGIRGRGHPTVVVHLPRGHAAWVRRVGKQEPLGGGRRGPRTILSIANVERR